MRKKEEFGFRSRFRITDLAVSPNGRLLAVGAKSRKLTSVEVELNVWHLPSRSLRYSVMLPGWEIRCGFSADSSRLATSCSDHMEFLRSATGKRLATIKREGCDIFSWVFSPDTKWLAIGFDDGQIEILNATDLVPQKRLKIKKCEYALEYSADGSLLAIMRQARSRSVLDLYDSESLSLVHSVASSRGFRIVQGHFLLARQLCVIAKEGKGRILDLDDMRILKRLEGLPPDSASGLSADSQHLVFATSSIKRDRKNKSLRPGGMISVFNLNTGEVRAAFQAHNDVVVTVQSIPGTKLIVSASQSEVKVWDLDAVMSSNCPQSD